MLKYIGQLPTYFYEIIVTFVNPVCTEIFVLYILIDWICNIFNALEFFQWSWSNTVVQLHCLSAVTDIGPALAKNSGPASVHHVIDSEQ